MINKARKRIGFWLLVPAWVIHELLHLIMLHLFIFWIDSWCISRFVFKPKEYIGSMTITYDTSNSVIVILISTAPLLGIIGWVSWIIWALSHNFLLSILLILYLWEAWSVFYLSDTDIETIEDTLFE